MTLLVPVLGGLLVATFAFLWWLRGARSTVVLPKSPVPWISHKTWRSLGLQEISEAGLPSIVHEGQVLQASPEDQERAPRLATSLAAPNPIALDDGLSCLTALKGTGSLMRPIWPYCCGTLTVLISAHDQGTTLARIEAKVGSLGDAYLQEELAAWASHDGWRATLEEYRQGKHSGEGLFAYTCAHCHKVYLCSGGPRGTR